MSDIDVLNIVKVNIHSICTEQTGDSDYHCANRPTAQRKNAKQETNRTEECYTNTFNISRYNNKNKLMVNNQLSNTVEYFILGLTYDTDKKKSVELTVTTKGL